MKRIICSLFWIAVPKAGRPGGVILGDGLFYRKLVVLLALSVFTKDGLNRFRFGSHRCYFDFVQFLDQCPSL